MGLIHITLCNNSKTAKYHANLGRGIHTSLNPTNPHEYSMEVFKLSDRAREQTESNARNKQENIIKKKNKSKRIK